MPKFKFLAVVEVEGVYQKGKNPFNVLKESEILFEPNGPSGAVLKANLLGLKCGCGIIPNPTRILHYDVKTKANKSKTNWITK